MAAILIGLAIVIVMGLVVAAGAVWYFLRTKPGAPKQPTSVAASAPAAPVTPANPTPSSAQPSEPATLPPAPAPEAPTVSTPRSKKARGAPPAPASATPSTNPQQEQIANFQNLARQAYSNGHYVEPADASAIAYLNRALAIDPTDAYSKTLLQDSVDGGKFQVQQAILRKDFSTAHRVAKAMAELLPNRKDVAGLTEDIASAERAEAAARHPAVPSPLVSFRAYHMHTDKSPADKGPSCLGTMSVVGQRLKFKGESATDGEVHTFDFGCSEIREIKKNSRVASHQGGFHLRTAKTNLNFVPENSSSAPVPALTSACSK